MAAQAYTPEVDPEIPPGGRQRLFQATTLTGCEGAPWEALHTAHYWAQGSPSGPDTPGLTEARVMQAKAMRNYHFDHPFKDSPAALRCPTDPPATMQTPAEPPYGTLASRPRTPSSNPTPPEPHHVHSRQSERDRKQAHPP